MTDNQRRRIHDIEYSCEGRAELAERIVGLEDKNAKLREELAQWERLTAGIELPEYPISQFQPKDLERENAELRERMELLTTILRNDCDIDARWDALRRFWSIELTEDGCLMRDRACKAEAENAKLRELVDQMYRDMQGVLDMSTDTVFVDSIGTLRDKMDWYMQAMAELGMPPADYEQRMRELGLRGEDA